ncbi:hypothetical protein POM88_038896 [Heracleum sosnowskyi]|uniref:BHLH domain-containing protein n=1 Tax=Heracleum sosnowskyi TaxID=360622 RepID=A0AAD8H9E5_9APIA|nr:hypothetical protein POM88_038896 [Heracleum sosnowskyi]
MGSRTQVAGKKHSRRGGVNTSNFERKMKKLQTVVPGGHRLHSNEELLIHTADYIVSMKSQLMVLKNALFYKVIKNIKSESKKAIAVIAGDSDSTANLKVNGFIINLSQM